MNPSTIQTGNYSVSFNGSNFAPDSQATANGVDVPTQFVSPTKLVVNGNAAAAGTIKFAVRQPGPGAVTGNAVSVTVTVPTVTVAVQPSAVSVPLAGSTPFTATVTGSDHGWGNHHLILGGAVQGGRMYGTFPTLALNGPDDSGSRGAMIPSTATEQYGATLAGRLGVSADQLPAVFPNLGNFATPNLGFLG